MEHAPLFILLLYVSCIIALDAPPSHLVRVAEREIGSVREWNIISEPHPLQQVDFKVLLKQRNLDVLEKTFWEVSDPKHANYGKFLNKKQVEDIIAPLPASKLKVIQWLEASGVPKSSMAVHSDYITITHNIAAVSKLFSTTFAVFQSAITSETRVRISTSIHIPKELSSEIDFVTGLSEFFEDKSRSHSRMKSNARAINATIAAPRRRSTSASTDPIVTPAVLQKYYGIPTTAASNPASTLGIGAFGDYFSPGALASFQTTFGLPKTVVTFTGDACTGSCGQTESDLDVQYSTALANGVPTTFYSHGGSLWVLDWAQQLTALSKPPLVNSASYGWSEKEQCKIVNCQTLGYTAQTYVSRTDAQFQALGVRGVTILVSSGDDGAPAFFNGVGSCPVDATKFCISGGCGTTLSATACANMQVSIGSTVCYYPMGINADSSGCSTVLNNANYAAAFKAFQTANPTCGISTVTDTGGNYQFITTCTCANLKAATSGTVTVAPYNYVPVLTTFESMYPAASPYVTAVGATQFTPTNGGSPTSEMVASIYSGALITSGGGFSAYSATPSYQTDHLATYLSTGTNVPPAGSFPKTNRAYPDIAFNGHNYEVVIATATGATTYQACPCQPITVDGTSCSSPGLAGLVALINDDLMNSGASPMGFLNPTLYQMHKDNPAAFTDITTGGNQCNRAYCCKYGFTASAGYDPVSGLGTPVFSAMRSYFLSGKGVGAGGDASGSSPNAVVAAVALPLVLAALLAAF